MCLERVNRPRDSFKYFNCDRFEWEMGVWPGGVQSGMTALECCTLLKLREKFILLVSAVSLLGVGD